MELKRHPQNPVFMPNPMNDWEALNVFNCAVVHHNGLFHMLYRAQGRSYTSYIGYAVSADGVEWKRLDKPVMSPELPEESRGVEDPRVVEVDGTFYMTYAAYGVNGSRAMLARSDNLITWERMKPFEWDNKDHVIFPRKIGGRYAMLHRRPPDIWIGYSDDMENWTDHKVVMKPRPGTWEDLKIGAAGPPIYTDDGWVLIYHGVNQDNGRTYRLGVALLDLEDPSKVINRARYPILEPEETWEHRGDVPHVVFSCANPVVDGTVYVFYGGADRVIGLATCSLEELKDYAANG